MVSADYEKCGISHYTTELLEAMHHQTSDLKIESIRIKDKSKFLLFYYNIIREIIKNEFRIIHIQHEFSLYDSFYGVTLVLFYIILKILSKNKRFKIITTLHTIWDLEGLVDSIDPKFSKNPLLLFIARVYILLHTKFICMISDKVVVLGKPGVYILLKQYGVEPSKVKYIHLGVYTSRAEEPTKEEVEKFKRKFNIKENVKIITLFGFPYPSKGYHYVVNALPEVIKECENLVLVIAGGLPDVGDINSLRKYFSDLKNMPRELGIENHVIFTGFLPWNDLNALFNITDLFVFPYEKRVNASASLNSVISYLKPIIVSESPLFDDLRDLKAVITVNVKNKKKLKSVIVNIIHSKSLRKILGSRLKKYIFKNSILNSARNHLKLYFKLIYI